MNAKPKPGTISASTTNPTEFAQCANLECDETVAREFVGQPGETHWYHRYAVGSPVRCPSKPVTHYGDKAKDAFVKAGDAMSNERRFTPGQQVIVMPDSFDYSDAWEGEIVSYWRNDAWIVREYDHGTTCAYNASRLHL